LTKTDSPAEDVVINLDRIVSVRENSELVRLSTISG
jgi:hypothetical protein